LASCGLRAAGVRRRAAPAAQKSRFWSLRLAKSLPRRAKRVKRASNSTAPAGSGRMQAAELDTGPLDTNLFAFQPNEARTRKVESRVRAGLAESLAASLRALGEKQAVAGQDLITRIRIGPISPVVFGAYTELVEAIFSDNIKAALAIADELCAPGFGRVGKLRIVTLDDAQLGRGQAARYRRLIDDDQEVGKVLRALPPAEFAPASQRVSNAITLLDAGMPELAGEIRTLVHEVIMVGKPGDWPFGASSFQLWGALFLKLKPKASRVEIAEQLAHECAHALLFGFGMGKPLVENEPQKLYPSPLRRDRRPMDGVVHATYVIARMHYTTSRLLQSGLLTEEETREARELIERNARGYSEGVAVVEAEARWTEVGEAALRCAEAYMDTALAARGGQRTH
jgi:hypothetical protein